MKQFLPIILFLIIGYPSFSQQNPEKLNNSSVIKLTKAKLSDSIIILKINQSNTQFDLSVDSLIRLKENGVSEKIIEVMMNKTDKPVAVYNGQSGYQVSGTSSNKPAAGQKFVEYKVTTTNPKAQFVVNYHDENGDLKGNLGSDGWTYSFNTSKKPFTAKLAIVANSNEVFKGFKVTLTISVDGKVVATEEGGINLFGGQRKILQYVIK